jgi:hypothetical protein
MPTTPEMKSFQERGTREAIEVAANCGMDFDLSPKSIHLLEEMLGALHEGVRQNPNLQGMEGCSMFYGSYVVSVIHCYCLPPTFDLSRNNRVAYAQFLLIKIGKGGRKLYLSRANPTVKRDVPTSGAPLTSSSLAFHSWSTL